jgi:hypothetical protein
MPTLSDITSLGIGLPSLSSFYRTSPCIYLGSSSRTSQAIDRREYILCRWTKTKSAFAVTERSGHPRYLNLDSFMVYRDPRCGWVIVYTNKLLTEFVSSK